MIWLILAGCSGRDCASVDADGDGAPAACPGEEATADGFIDCDDSDGSTRPGADEVCDGVDNDCDGTADEGLTLTYFLDEDGDGYGGTALETCEPPSGYVRLGGDCDDTDATLTPGATEVCDGIDNDCDGTADDGAGEQLWYADLDEDGHPGEGDSVQACEPPDGYQAAPAVWDCDDTDAAISPGAEEACDELDNDCDGDIDEGVPSVWYTDADGDGFGNDTVTTGENCLPDDGYTLNSGDCDDNDASVGEVFSEPLDGDGVIVEAADMADLCPCYTEISGELRIRTLSDSTDLAGLSCIESVESILIYDSDSLTSLDGLNNLQFVEKDITIQDNALLSDLSALSNITTLSEYLSVEDNDALTDLSGLSGLTTIDGALILTSNASMTRIGLDALEQLGSLSLSSSTALEEITGLTSLAEVERSFNVENCSALTTIDLPALTSIGSALYLYNNADLTDLSAPLLSDVGGELRLHWAAGVTNLDGLSGMREVGGDLVLWGNADLSDVTGLHDVEFIGGDLNISNNPDLVTEDAEALQDDIETIRGEVTISNNG
ncbi:MAG: hypothetical protein ACI8RZ_004614 [Myxococcota bacterium]|jgi:hypothetical protein